MHQAADVHRLGQDHPARLWPGLAMGAKLAHPDKLCINVWGDAAIGFTGMDFETCVRERIPIMSILLNNFSMAIEIPIMPISQAKYTVDRYFRRLRRDGPRLRWLRRAHHRSKGNYPGDQARHCRDQEGQCGAARVHHQEGNGDLAAICRRHNSSRTNRRLFIAGACPAMSFWGGVQFTRTDISWLIVANARFCYRGLSHKQKLGR